jgi:hypothetical protein
MTIRDLLKDAASANAELKLNELKSWCQIAQNKQMLKTVSFDSTSSFDDQMNRAFSLISHKEAVDVLKTIQSELLNLIKDVYYSAFIKSEFFYKNLIGLNKKKDPNTRSKQQPEADSSKSKMKKSKSDLLNNTDSATNLDANHLSTSSYPADDLCDYANDESSLISSFQEQEQDSDNENDTDDFYRNAELNNNEKDYDDNNEQESGDLLSPDQEPNLTTRQSRPNQVRFDLINDIIKDEFLLDSSLSRISNVSDETTFDLKLRQYSKDEDDEQDENDQEQADEMAMNCLSNLRICIDEIEELVDKSNSKTCLVFVIQVRDVSAKCSKILCCWSNGFF